MKSLSELGISPWPWKADEEGWVDDVNGEQVITNAGALVSLRDIRKNPDASLIAAAPEIAKVCYDLIMWDGCRDASICDIVAAAKAAYAKASGEEVA